ncbi:MAG: YfcC family protein [Thermaurantimonas sp.]
MSAHTFQKSNSPDSILLIIAFLGLVYLLSFVIPSGRYERIESQGRTVLVPGSYQPVEKDFQSIMKLLSAPARGFTASAEVIAFVLLIGGAFGVINATGALESGLKSMVELTTRHKILHRIFPAVLIFIFSLAGNTFGMSEEVIVFVLIILPLARQMGYDTLTGLAIPFIGAGVGFAGAAFNPFTVGIAQGIAELPPFSGFEYRMVIWSVFTLAAVVFIYRHMYKISLKPEAGYFSEIPFQESSSNPRNEITLRHKLVIMIFLGGILLLIAGVKLWNWYIPELAGLFIGVAVISAGIAGLRAGDGVGSFLKGCGDMLPVVVIIGLSRSILVLAEDSLIIDTILHAVVSATGHLPLEAAVQIMFLVQGMINFFIPSGSGQAALTMPLMTPLADLLGIHRQTAVLAFQFGDGIFNMIIPTSGVTMGVLSIAKVPYRIWLSWCGKLIIWLVILSMAALAISVVLNVW